MPRREKSTNFSYTCILGGCFGIALAGALLSTVRFHSLGQTPSVPPPSGGRLQQDQVARFQTRDAAASSQEPSRPAASAPDLADATCEQHILQPLDAISEMSQASFPVELGRCAMVGSAKSLQGQALGSEIDAHDTVVRMNRLPVPELFVDMGMRTDVYFKNLLADFTYNKTRVWYMEPPSQPKSKNPPGTWCDHISKDGCDFRAILYEGASREQQSKLQWLSRRQMAVPYAYQSNALHAAEHSFALFGQEKKVPSAGFKAFMTCAVLCDSIRLYGFAGGSTLDGHFLAHSRHDLDMEHKVFGRLSVGNVSDSDFTPRKVMEHGRPDAAFVAKLKQRLACLGKAGNIVLVQQ